jgi:phosphoglucan,water dikinase
MNETGRIRIGNQTAFSASTVTGPFVYAVDNGFDAFEWFPDKKDSGAGWEEDDLDAEIRRYINQAALEHDIRLSVHAPWDANPLRLGAPEVLVKNIAFAQDIGASLLNIHLYADEGIASYVQAIAPLVKHLAQVRIKLAIENTPLTGPETFNELFRKLRKACPADTAYMGMCLDIGHANLCEATRNDYLKFIDLLDFSVPIIHVHLHENYGDSDSHLPLFTGPAGKDATGIEGVIKRLQKRNFSGSIIFEQWPEPPSLLNEARNRLFEIIGEPARQVKSARRAPGEVLPQADDFASAILEANRRCRSWRQKLGWIHDLLVEDGLRLNAEHLAYLAIYLHFIGTGEVTYSENGGHHRPSHHAKMGRRMHDRLSKMTTPDNIFVIRKIYAWLPSFGSAFTRAEPLTRIRDIAHRNDVPKELKREIKNTLQNKLHRCAGPEDLVTSAALLERITARAVHYSVGFVEEFRQFHEELKEFFNARSLEEQLEVIADKDNTQGIGLIRRFLEAKRKADTPKEQLATFEHLTRLRGHLAEEIKGNTGSEAQQFLLADIRLEDFSFVLMSQLINYFESLGDGMPWSPALYALSLTVENLRLSGFGAEECHAVEFELKLWRQKSEPQDIQQLIRLKATIDRCQQLAEDYCDKILDLFPEKVERLGRALGVAEHAIKVYSEADIRSHLAFQLSKLVSLLLKTIRTRAAVPK